MNDTNDTPSLKGVDELPQPKSEEPKKPSTQEDWGIGQMTMSPLEQSSAEPQKSSEPGKTPEPLQRSEPSNPQEPVSSPGEVNPPGEIKPPESPSETEPPPPPEPPKQEEQKPPQPPGQEAPSTTPSPTGQGETLVIPPAQPANTNPFVPQGGAPSQPGEAPKGSSFGKRLLTILIILLVLIGLGVGGFIAYQRLNTNKEVTLTYWGLWENNVTIQTILTGFQTEHPNIKVQYVKQSPQQYRERLQAAIARGEGPDVFEFHNTWVPMLTNELAPAPSTIMTTSEFSSTFYPVASADLVGGSNICGMPMMFDGLGLYYNVDLLAAAGASPPTTWPELLDVVPKLTVKTDTQIQKSAIALGTTGNVENYSDIVALMMMQNGARLTVPTGKEAEDTLTFYHKFANPSDPVYTWNDSMDNSVYAFATGQVAMILAPSWRVFDIKQISPNLNFKITTVPQLPGNTINWASYWVEGVSSKSTAQEAAWTFVKYLTSKDTVSKLYDVEAKARLFGEPYARTDLANTLASDPYVGAYIAEAPTAKSFPLASRTFDNGINDKMIKYLENAINSVSEGTSPTEALSTASQGFAQVLGSYGLSTGAAPATTP